MSVENIVEESNYLFRISMECPFCNTPFQLDHQAYKRVGSGYIRLSIPSLDDETYYMRGVPEHTYTWEKYHGKRLPVGYIIHHANGVKEDNRIENLIAMPKCSHNSNLQETKPSVQQIHCPFCKRQFPMVSS